MHPLELEALWGLEGAARESFVARGGDIYLEVVRYDEPRGRPNPDGFRLSDQGFMNVALGYREEALLSDTYDRVIKNGYRDNFQVPHISGGTYLNDDQGNTLEFLLVPREFDPSFGFAPLPLLHRPPSWPQPSVGAAAP
ncbi:MAG: hypothetical protein ACYDHH_12615 [Solirubrobacteraceae bacterium]